MNAVLLESVLTFNDIAKTVSYFLSPQDWIKLGTSAKKMLGVLTLLKNRTLFFHLKNIPLLPSFSHFFQQNSFVESRTTIKIKVDLCLNHSLLRRKDSGKLAVVGLKKTKKSHSDARLLAQQPEVFLPNKQIHVYTYLTEEVRGRNIFAESCALGVNCVIRSNF